MRFPLYYLFFFFNNPATPEISPLPLHAPFPIPLAEAHPRLDDERITAVYRRRPGHRRVEVALDLLVQAVEDRLLADGRDAVGRRRHDLGRQIGRAHV